jgi:hypothetical protein
MRLRRFVPVTLLLGVLPFLPWAAPAAATSEDAQVPSLNGPVPGLWPFISWLGWTNSVTRV